MGTRILILLFIINSLLGCNRKEAKNIVVKGVVFNKETNKPISNAQIVILAWEPSLTETDGLEYTKKEFVSDKNGFFSGEFDAALKLDIASTSEGYKPTLKRIDEISSNDILVKLPLELMKVNNFSSQVYVKQPLFLGYKKFFTKENNSIELLGINLNTLDNSDLNKSDLYVEYDPSTKTPKRLICKPNTGILPIYKEKNKSLIFDFLIAPDSGYQVEHNVTGEEAGYFLKHGNGYCKLIMKERIDSSIPYKDGYYKEEGYTFEAICNPVGVNLAVNRKIDLEDYILENM